MDRLIAALAVLALFGGLAGGAAGTLVLLNREVALAILGVGSALSATFFLVLFRRFRSQAPRHKIQTLEAEAKGIGDELRERQAHLNQLTKRRKELEAERRSQIEAIKPAYREKSADLNAMFANIDRRESDEVEDVLTMYQEAFIRSAIADASIRRVRVPGFTARILEKLEEAGILTAVDITPERLRTVPDLDPFLAQELDLWRQRVERDATGRKPLNLPASRLDPIRARYQEERMAVKASIESLVFGMQNEIMSIEARISEQFTQLDILEDNLVSQVAELDKEYQDARERIRPLESYNFWHYLLASLGIK